MSTVLIVVVVVVVVLGVMFAAGLAHMADDGDDGRTCPTPPRADDEQPDRCGTHNQLTPCHICEIIGGHRSAS